MLTEFKHFADILVEASTTPEQSANTEYLPSLKTLIAFWDKAPQGKNPHTRHLSAFLKKTHKIFKLAAQSRANIGNVTRLCMQNLQADHRVLIPLPQGLGEFRRQQNGELIFLVWSSGEGIKKHVSSDDAVHGTSYAPVRAFRCDASNTTGCEDFIQNALKYACAKEASFENHQHVISLITAVSGKEIDSAPYYQHRTADKTGFNAWKMWTTYLRNAMLDDPTFEEMQYEIAKETLSTALNEMETYREIVVRFPKIIKLMERACTRFAARLKHVAKTLPLDKTRQDAGWQLIEKGRLLCKTPVSLTPDVREVDSHFSAVTPSPIQCTAHQRFKNPLPKEFLATSTPSTIQPKVDYTITTPAIHTIDDAEHAMNQILQVYPKPDELHGIELSLAVRKMEAVLLAWPLTPAFVAAPHQVKINTFANTLCQFMQQYCSMAQRENRSQLSSTVAIYSGVALLELMANQHFSDRPDILRSLYSVKYFELNLSRSTIQAIRKWGKPVQTVGFFLRDFIGTDHRVDPLPTRDSELENALKHHGFTSHSAKHYHRLTQIKSVLKQHESEFIEHNEFYLGEIAAQNKALCQEAQQGEKNKQDKKELARYLHKNFSRLKVRYPTICEEAEFCAIYRQARSVDRYQNARAALTEIRFSFSNGKIQSIQDALHDRQIFHGQIPMSLNDRELRRDFFGEPSSVNKTQITQHASTITPRIDVRRMVQQIGANAKSQVVAAIEYLQANATQIGSHDMQSILFMFLFDKALMAEEIHQNPKSIEKLIDIIEKGLDFYAEGKWNQPLAFYLTVNTFLRKMLLEISPHTATQEALLNKTERSVVYIDKILAANNTAPVTVAKTLAPSVEIVKIVELSNQLKKNKKLTAEQLVEFYRLNATLKYSRALQHAFMRDAVQDALIDLAAYATREPMLTTEAIIVSLLQALHIDRSTEKIIIDFPHVQVGKIRLHLMQGEISGVLGTVSALPAQFYNTSFGKQKFNHIELQAKKYADLHYEFTHQKENYRVFEYPLTIQKAMPNVEGETTWYQLQSHQKIGSTLPATIINDEHWIWQSKVGDLIVVNKKTDRPVLVYSAKEGAAYFVDQQGTKINQVISDELNCLSCFEKQDYIEIVRELSTGATRIRLPRYGINFTEKVIDNKHYYVSDEDPTLCLLNTSQFLSDIQPSLVLATLPNEREPARAVKVLLPREQADGTPHLATYFYIHDKIKPASAIDAYHLASVYQRQGQVEQAQAIIADYAHQFSGHPEEMHILKKMLSNKSGVSMEESIALTAWLAYTFVKGMQRGHVFEAKDIEFFNQYAQRLMELYLVFQDDIPHALRLKKHHIVAILKFSKQQPSHFYLDVQKKKRTLNAWMKEYHHLSQLDANLSYKVRQRKEKIAEKLFKEYAFVPQQKVRVLTTHDVSKTKVMNLDTDRFAQGVMLDQLSIDTDITFIQSHWQALFDEAITSSEREAKWHAFLDAKILSYIDRSKKDKKNKLLQRGKEHIKKAILGKIPPFLATWVSDEVVENVSLPEVSEYADEVYFYSMLKSMIAHKADVIMLRKQYAAGKLTEVYDGIGEHHNIFSIEGALNYFLNYRNVKFDREMLKKMPAEKRAFTFFSHISNKHYVNTITSMASPQWATLDHIIATTTIEQALSASVEDATKNATETLFSVVGKNGSLFHDTLIQSANEDYHAGKKIAAQREQDEKKWHAALEKIDIQNDLKEKIAATLKKEQPALDALLQQIVTTMNRGPKEANAQRQWQLAIASKTQKVRTLEDALKYFSTGCLTSLKEKCHLDKAEAELFLSQVQQYLQQATQHQQYQRILDHLAALSSEPLSEDSKQSCLTQLSAALTQRRVYDIAQYRDFLIFEYLDNKLLYAKQVSLLKKMLKQTCHGGYSSVAVQLIMGGGKSKVLLPLLVKMRANGTNLNIVEVPSALLETNFYDLHATSKKLGQDAHIFKFSRDLPIDSNYLYRLKSHWRSVIANKGYIVTTRESIQSLELKYIDLITHPQDNLIEWEKQIRYLDDLINLLQQKGDAILDEIDLNLRTKDQLIYTVSEGAMPPRYCTQSIMALYQSFSKINAVVDGSNINLADVVSSKITKPSPRAMTLLLNTLQRYLLSDPTSPIQCIIAKLSAEERKTLEAFFDNRVTALPAFFERLALDEKSILSIYKEHLTRLLPLSLSKKLGEHFGFSKDCAKNLIEQAIAIPYMGNDLPNEMAKFKSDLLTMNYTIQAHWATPISFAMLKEVVENFKQKRLAEKNINAYTQNTQCIVQAQFDAIIGSPMPLESIDLNDQEALQLFYETHKNNNNIKNYYLTEQVLPAIVNNPVTLCSNDQNHVSIYRSVSGFTGTDYNYRCFHGSIVRDATDSMGTDGQTLTHLLKKERPTHVLSHNDSQALFQLLKEHKDLSSIRAFMDVGAQFRGISNRNVADQIARFYAQRPALAMKHVLYFNEENLLCALPVGHEPEHEEAFVLGSSENISEKLGCPHDQCFTYYDQAHTTGADIQQAPGTIGLVTVSEDRMLRDILQSVMRLRDLKKTHHVEFVVMEPLQKKYPNIAKWDVRTIVNVCLEHQAKTLMQEHLASAMNKMNNIVRQDMLERIRTASSNIDKMILSDASKAVLYEVDIADYVEKYGMPEQMVETEVLLKRVQAHAVEKWRTCLQRLNKKIDSSELAFLVKQMDDIIRHAVMICAPKQKSTLQDSADAQVISQIQLQSQREVEQETEIQRQSAFALPRGYVSWKDLDLSTYRPGQKGVGVMSLEAMASSHRRVRGWQFDTNLLASENYHQTCWLGNTDKLDRFKKPIFYVLNFLEGQALTKILITQDEAQEIREKLANTVLPAGRSWWVETPSGIPYTGERVLPEGGLNETRLMEQIQFFNADVIYLAANYDKLSWFKEHATDKVDYLEKELLTIHSSKAASLPMLKEILRRDEQLTNEARVSWDLSRSGEFEKVRDGYLYPHENKLPSHTPQEYARLRAYVDHRENKTWFAKLSMAHWKKSAIAWGIRKLKQWVTWGSLWLFENHGMFSQLWNYLRANRYRLGKQLGIASVITLIATGALAYFAGVSLHYIGVLTLWKVVLGGLGADVLLYRKMTAWQQGIGLGVATLSTVGLLYSYGIGLNFLWISSLYSMLWGTLLSSIGAVILLRHSANTWQKASYDSITKIHALQDPYERYALKKGVESSTHWGYLSSWMSPTCYVYSKAYRAGLAIGADPRESVLVNEIKRMR